MKKFFFLFLLMPFASFSQSKKLLGNSLDSTRFIVTDLQKYLIFKLDSERVRDDSHFWTYKQAPKKIMNLTGDSVEVSEDRLCGVSLILTNKKELKGTGITTSPVTVKKILIFGPSERIDKIFREYLRPLFKEGSNFSEGGQWIKSENIMAVWDNGDPNSEIPLKNISIEFD